MWEQKNGSESHIHSKGGRIATVQTLSELPQDNMGKGSRF
jgi:hypothetical protein